MLIRKYESKGRTNQRNLSIFAPPKRTINHSTRIPPQTGHVHLPSPSTCIQPSSNRPLPLLQPLNLQSQLLYNFPQSPYLALTRDALLQDITYRGNLLAPDLLLWLLVILSERYGLSARGCVGVEGRVFVFTVSKSYCCCLSWRCGVAGRGRLRGRWECGVCYVELCD